MLRQSIKASIVVILIMNQSVWASGLLCAKIFDSRESGQSLKSKPSVSVKAEFKELDKAWNQSVLAMKGLKGQIIGVDHLLHGLLTVSLAKEFAWINGEPGGGKTFAARKIFEGQLKSLNETDKLFLLQFHKLLTEGRITGYQVIKSSLDQGKYEIETQSSLANQSFKFFIGDEVEKTNPAVAASTLSVLAERKIFIGTRSEDVGLISGVFTSNMSIADYRQSFGSDLPTADAFLDRNAVKIHVLNQQLTPRGKFLVNQKSEQSKKIKSEIPALPIPSLTSIVDKVLIPDEMLVSVARIIRQFDSYVTPKSDSSTKKTIDTEGQELESYFPANQFSNRSDLKALKIMKASFLAEQLLNGVGYDQLRLTMEPKDLYHIATAATYVAPFRVQPKLYELKAEIDLEQVDGTVDVRRIGYDPSSDRIVIYNESENSDYIVLRRDLKPGVTLANGEKLGREAVSEIETQIQEINKNKSEILEFEVDQNRADLVLNKKTLDDKTTQELRFIYDDMRELSRILTVEANASKKSKRLSAFRAAFVSEKNKFKIEAEKIKKALSNPQLSPQDRQKIVFEGIRILYKQLTHLFPETEYVVRAHLASFAASNHIYLFGPPGGAKTNLSRLLVESELAGMKQSEQKEFLDAWSKRYLKQNPKDAKMFFLQLHKMHPDTIITGGSKIQAQIDRGIIEWNLDGSMASKDVLFAVIDEVEKGNPAVFSSLLSLLNEREVFHGNEVFKAGLITAILTSNKNPQQIIDSMGKDKSTAKAWLDRTINKVFLNNKFASEQALVKLLASAESKLDRNVELPISIFSLQEQVQKVDLPDNVGIFVASVIEKFQAERIAQMKKTQKEHQFSAEEYPHFYFPASSASDRTFAALIEQWKANFIIDQILSGKNPEQMRYVLNYGDLALLLPGLAYWGPYRIDKVISEDSVIQYRYIENSTLDKLIGSSFTNEHNRNLLMDIRSEVKDFVEITNQELKELFLKHRELVNELPDLLSVIE